MPESYPALVKHDYPPSVLVTALPLIARAQPRLLASGTFYVAESQGRILGAGGWSWGGPQGGASPTHMAHVRHVITDHGHVRRGIGRALVGHVIAEATRAGARLMDCQATLTAVPFYAALGFREIGPLLVDAAAGDRVSGGQDAVVPAGIGRAANRKGRGCPRPECLLVDVRPSGGRP